MHQKTSPKILSADFILSAVQKVYDLQLTKPPQAIGEGIENAAWVFHTHKGNFIIKIFEKGETIIKDVKEEVSLYEYLLHHDIHVPEVILSVTNEKVVILTKDDLLYPAILMRYETLTRYPASALSKEQLNKIASTIAHMHKVLMVYPRKEHVRKSIHDAMAIYNHSMKDFDRFLTSPNAKSLYLQDHERLRKIRTDAINYLQKQKLAENLTRSVLHNDLALGHLLFMPNNDLYIFDFSDFEYGPVALDLGVLFFNFYREGDLTIEEWRSMIKDFLSIYTKIVPITQNDKKAIDIFTVSRMLEHIRYLDDMSTQHGFPVDDKGVKKRYDLLEQLYLDKS